MAEAKKWYVVHTYSGFENKAKKSLEEKIRMEGLQDSFGEILIPVEQVVEMVKGEKKTSKRKFLPGYILVQMEMNDRTWHLVKNTPKVTGFIGAAANEQPPPIPDREMERLTTQISEGTLKPKPKVQFEEGDTVRVIDGPFIESKELLGGFAVMELSDMAEAIAMCRRYAAILGGTLEIDVRLVDQDDD